MTNKYFDFFFLENVADKKTEKININGGHKWFTLKD